MPYATSIAVGTVFGFVGLATMGMSGAMTGRESASTAPPADVSTSSPLVETKVELISNAPAFASDRNASYLPPRRVPAELVGLAPIPKEGMRAVISEQAAARDATAGGVEVPLGKHVEITLSASSYPTKSVSGELAGVDGEWIQLRDAEGTPQLIARNQVVLMRVEPTDAIDQPAIANVEQ